MRQLSMKLKGSLLFLLILVGCVPDSVFKCYLCKNSVTAEKIVGYYWMEDDIYHEELWLNSGGTFVEKQKLKSGAKIDYDKKKSAVIVAPKDDTRILEGHWILKKKGNCYIVLLDKALFECQPFPEIDEKKGIAQNDFVEPQEMELNILFKPFSCKISALVEGTIDYNFLVKKQS